jgi:integrase
MRDSSSQTRPASRRLEKTKTRGIYKRGGRYCVIYRDPSGRQRKRSARTLAEARELKATLTADVKRGEWRERSQVRFADYWEPWVKSYAGRTSRGFRENTRLEYFRALERFAVPYFGRRRLAEIEPADIREFLVKLADDGFAEATISGILAPLRAMLADAVEDRVIRYNPAAGVRIPTHAKKPDTRTKYLNPDEVERLRAKLPDERARLPVDFLLATGLRISEALALDWRHIDLATGRVRVERRLYRGLDAPKSETSKRTLRVSPAMAARLAAAREARAAGDDDPVFVGPRGGRLDYSNAYNRILVPAMRAAGIEYGGFHRLRHTTGTELRRRGVALDHVQAQLGHHDLAFTKRVYVHTTAEDGPDPSLLDDLAGCDRPRLRVVA